MCRDVADTYDEMLDSTQWLSEETRKEAKNKLKGITINAVYPDKWEDYSVYSVKEDGNVITARLDHAKAKEQQDISKMNGAVDREIWEGIDILETNAYYNPYVNSINIIPGFFCDVTYRSDMSIEEKYGALGAVIGHEISHAFDSNGAQYDENGSLHNWWTDEDRAAFGERVSKVADYFGKIVPFDDGTPNNGKLIQTEATADMGGIKCMLMMAKKIDGFDYDKFFRAYAYMWRRMDSLQMCERLATADPRRATGCTWRRRTGSPCGKVRRTATIIQKEDQSNALWPSFLREGKLNSGKVINKGRIFRDLSRNRDTGVHESHSCRDEFAGSVL